MRPLSQPSYAIPSTLVLLTILCIAPAAAAELDRDAASGVQPTAANSAWASDPALDQSLERLAITLAAALEDDEVRELFRESLVARPGTTLFDLLDHGFGDGSSLFDRLAAAHGGEGEALLALLESLPPVELAVAGARERWLLHGETPLTAYVADGVRDDDGTATIFNPTGPAFVVDTEAPLEIPVLVLEVHRSTDAVRTVEGGEPPVPATGIVNVSAGLASGSCTNSTLYKSYPLIVRASITDIHEGLFNGPEGFAYFAAAGTEKTGTLPSTLGGRSGWSTNVWASNFQGPILVTGESSRLQWEWTADGWLQTAYRTYPALYCQQSASNPSYFGFTEYLIMEDDDGFLQSDDVVGYLPIDHRFCKSDVFDRGLSSGWTGQITLLGREISGENDVESVTYDLYCSSTPRCTATTQCPGGWYLSCSASGACGSACNAGGNYVQCGSWFEECPPPCPGGEIICLE